MINEPQPLVSVLMTAYNREKYIAEAMQSVLDTSYSNWELIIADDCSTDNTVAIAKEFAERDERISVYVNKQNLGQFANRNMAASYARGKYLKYLDSDDKILKEGLSYCVNSMEQYSTASIAMQWAFKTDTDIAPACFDSSTIIRQHFFNKQYLVIGPSGTIIKKSAFDETGGYDTRFGVPSDMYFNLKIACAAPVVLLPNQFFFYREHEGQELNNQFDYLYNNYLYMKAAIKELNLPLTKEELKWLDNKCNRRFLVNCFNFLVKTKKLKQLKEVLHKTNFGLREVLSGLFH